MNARRVILVPLLLVLLPSGCATHELVLSRTLRPVLASEGIDFQPTLFRARVQMTSLEVRGRIRHSDLEYKSNFDCEIASAAALGAALVRSGIIFEHDWRYLKLLLTHEYGSQWRWKNTLGSIKVIISRETLLELRERNVPASEYPQYWHLVAYKWGPPDYVPYVWPSACEKNNPSK